MNPEERLKQWAGRSWWRWLLVALPFVLLAVAGMALWPRGQSAQPIEPNIEIDNQADKQLERIEQKRKQAADAVREELNKRQSDLHHRSQTAPADALRDELLRGANDD